MGSRNMILFAESQGAGAGLHKQNHCQRDRTAPHALSSANGANGFLYVQDSFPPSERKQVIICRFSSLIILLFIRRVL